MTGSEWNKTWPLLRRYRGDHLARIAMPLGGIGTGCVSLGGRGQLRDWEIRNRPAKGYVPLAERGLGPFFAVRARPAGAAAVARVLEGPIPPDQYEGASGCPVPLHGLPHFRQARFGAAYPFGQVLLDDPAFPLTARLEAFNPLIPTDPERSGLPVAVLRYVFRNPGDRPVAVSVCGTLLNLLDPPPGSAGERLTPVQERRSEKGLEGVLWRTTGGDRDAEHVGTLALAAATVSGDEVTVRTGWPRSRWGEAWIGFWNEFLRDGSLRQPDDDTAGSPAASLTLSRTLPPGGETAFLFVMAWHYPNRRDWRNETRVGNWYTTRDADAWAAAVRTAEALPDLERDSLAFVRAFCRTALPAPVKEAALFNLSTLRTPTCFRTEDGHFFGWEGCCDGSGCCFGSCTHVWNYETALPYLFGSLSRSMREVSFLYSTDDQGLMSFRSLLPLRERGQAFGKAAADGQMGALMRLYLDWKLGGDEAWLRRLWPAAKRAMAFCWIPGGWDADRDGVMEGCQHNTMDVEYFGPNPQMGFWYLGALLAVAEMARRVGDAPFAAVCQSLYERGRPWIMKHLFNGDYFEHRIQPPGDAAAVAPGLRIGMGAPDLVDPKYQLGAGCLVDQLVGQVFARLCGLEHLVPPELVERTLRSIYRFNRKTGFQDHFNPMRSYVLGEESALLMAAYPRDRRPEVPFPYADEVMSGFEYTAICGMFQEGMTEEGLSCLAAIRDRYDGLKRNPFDEAECGHHYARAMMSWTAVPALTGFRYDADTGRMRWGAARGFHVWSTGFAWGTLTLRETARGLTLALAVCGGTLRLERVTVERAGEWRLGRTLASGQRASVCLAR